VDLKLSSARSSIQHITNHINEQNLSSDPDPVPLLKPYECDVTQEEQVKQTLSDIVRDFGKVDCLVTAAGIVDNVEAEKYEYPRWKKMIDINLDGTFLFAREAGRHMLEQKIKGSIILVGSMSASICVRPQKQAAYNAVCLLCLYLRQRRAPFY
jgi:sorbose reductase